MKKLLSASSTALVYLLHTPITLAQAPARTQAPDVNIVVQPPERGINVQTDVGTIISNGISIIFVVAILAVLFMLVTGGFNWIMSGGDKDAIGKARARILNALIGLVILAVAFVLARVAGQIVNIDVFNLSIPRLDKVR